MTDVSDKATFQSRGLIYRKNFLPTEKVTSRARKEVYKTVIFRYSRF